MFAIEFTHLFPNRLSPINSKQTHSSNTEFFSYFCCRILVAVVLSSCCKMSLLSILFVLWKYAFYLCG